MPRRWAVGNWKMHTTRDEATALAAAIREGLDPATWDPKVLGVGLAPPFPFLDAVREAVDGTPIAVVAQDCHAEAKGAFTSAVSVPMLASVGATHVIVGHSERRSLFGDDDPAVRAKVEAVLAGGLGPIVCVGERLEQREAGEAKAVVEAQVRAALDGLGDARDRLVVAYEPVWAIGTGKVATPDQVGEMHTFLTALLIDVVGGPLPVLYGGSVKPGNVDALAEAPGVAGVLVGGASLDAGSFLQIVAACAREGTERWNSSTSS